MCSVFGGFHEPAGHVIKRFPRFTTVVEDGPEIGLLFVGLPGGTEIRRIPADIRLAAFVLEVNLALIERRFKEVVRLQLHARTRQRANAQPVQPQRVATGDPVFIAQGQKLGQGQLLPPVQHVTLVLGDDQRKAGDLRREVAQLDPAKIGDRDF